MDITESTQKKQIISVEDAYWALNTIVNDVFFNGRFDSQPIYLDMEGDLREEIRLGLGIDDSKLDKHIGCIVSRTLKVNSTFNIYQWHMDNADVWTAKHRFKSYKGLEPPPFTALLLGFSLAAENMRASEDYSPNNYYGRVAELFGIKKYLDHLKKYSKDTKQFWIYLNSWLQDNDFAYGRPTAQQVFKGWTYASYPLSQALVRQSDRDAFKKLFIKYGLSKHDNLSEQEVEPYIAHWIPNSTSFLQKMWAKNHLRERVVASVLEALDNWHGEVSDESGDNFSKRMFWVSRIKKYPKTKVVLNLCTSAFDSTNKLSLFVLNQKNKKELVASNLNFNLISGTEYSYLGPLSSIALGELVSGQLSVESGEGNFANHSRTIIPLLRSETGSYYKEVSQVVLFNQYQVLCHSSWRGKVAKHLAKYAKSDYKIIDSSDGNGLPAGWCLFENVELVAVPDVDTHEDLQDLVPAKRGASFHLSGGLQITRGVWHKLSPPQIFATDDDSTLDIKVEKVSFGEIKPFIEIEDSVSNPSFLYVDGKSTLASESSESMVFKAFKEARKSPLTEKSISFRSAKNPKLHTDAKDLQLYYGIDRGRPGLGFLSADSVGDKKSEVFTGLDVNYLSECNGIEQNSGFKAMPFVGSGEFEIEVANSLDDYKEEGRLSGYHRCLERGYHIWLVPEGVTARTPMATFRCGDCGLALIYRGKKRNARNQGRSAPNNVPETINKIEPMRKDMPVTHDVVLDALSYQGFGSSGLLQKLMGHLVDSPWKVTGLVRDYVDLGHIDTELNPDTLRENRWSIAPPVFVRLDNNMGYIAGYRSYPLLAELEEIMQRLSAKKLGGWVDDAPLRFAWDLSKVNFEELEVGLSSINLPFNIKLQVVANVAEKIVNILPRFNEMLSSFKTVSPPEKGLEVFDAASASWKEHRGILKSGAYRYQNFIRQYFYIGADNQAKHLNFELAKIASARLVGLRLHDYDAKHKEFHCMLGCDLPGLYRRALVSCSGNLPKVVDDRTVYENVSSHIAYQVLNKLYK